MVAVLLRLVFGKAVGVAVPLALLWVMWRDPGGVRTWGIDLVTDHFVDDIKNAVLPAGG